MSREITFRILVAAIIPMVALSGLVQEWLPANSASERISGDQCEIPNTTFNGGEEIIYKVFYNWGFIWLQAGEVKFSVEESPEEYIITAIGHTYESYDRFYRVRDTFITHVDKETLLPNLFIRDVEEGKYRKYNKFIFDQANARITAYEGKSAADLKMAEVEVSDCMHDILSILYFMRNLSFDDVQVNDSFPVEVFLEEEYPINVRILQKDEKKRVKGFGKFQTHVFSPDLIAGTIFDETGEMIVHVTADNNKLPVAIESPLTVGKVKVYLLQHRGLKYDLDALIK